MSSSLPTKNRLTFSADFDPGHTDWVFGGDNPILPLKPLRFSRTNPVINPDGSGPAYLVSISKHASQHGCIRKSFEPLMEASKLSSEWSARLERHDQALAHYRSGRLEEALLVFSELGEDDDPALYRSYGARIRTLIDTG